MCDVSFNETFGGGEIMKKKNKLLMWIIIGILILALILIVIFYNNRKCEFRDSDKCKRICTSDSDCGSSCCGCINKEELCSGIPRDTACEREVCKCINNTCKAY
mgnify:CR=1 FL=1